MNDTELYVLGEAAKPIADLEEMTVKKIIIRELLEERRQNSGGPAFFVGLIIGMICCGGMIVAFHIDKILELLKCT